MFHQAKLNGGVARFRPSADTAGPGSFIQNAAVERVVVTGGETVNLLHPLRQSAAPPSPFKQVFQ